MDSEQLRQKALDFATSVMNDETLTIIEKLDYFNHVKTLSDFIITIALDYLEGEDEDGR